MSAGLGRLPFNTTLSFSGTQAYLTAYMEADADYDIDEVALSPDPTAVSSASFYGSIIIVQGGADITKGVGTSSSTSENARPGIGNARVGLLQDPTDPIGQGHNEMALLAQVGSSNIWRIPGQQPRLRQGDILVIVIVNKNSVTNTGIITAQVNGHQVPRED